MFKLDFNVKIPLLGLLQFLSDLKVLFLDIEIAENVADIDIIIGNPYNYVIKLKLHIVDIRFKNRRNKILFWKGLS